MNEQIQMLRRQLRMIWLYRWWALALSTAICLFGWFTALTMPNIYEVKAKIFVDTRSMLRPLLKGLAIDSETLASSASLMKRTLLTRPNLEEVARKTDLDLGAKGDREFDELVTHLAAKVKLEGTSQDNIYEIAFTNSSPQQAKRVVDELLNTFLESALGSNRKDTAATQKFLDEQIAEYEKRLIEAEQRLKEFKRRNSGHMPEEGGSYFRTLQETRRVLEKAELELAESEVRRTALRRQLEGDEPTLGMGGTSAAASNFSGPVSSQYDGRIAKLQDQMDQLRLQFTDKHPDIAAIREQIETLQARRDEELKALAEERAAQAQQHPEAEVAPPETGESGVYQEIKLSLAESEGEVAALTARVAAYKKQVADLEASVDTIPEIEAELKRLNRDYGLNKQQYDELLKRREAARMSQEVDQQADDVKLKVIEPPRVPLQPIGPNRIAIMSMVLFGGLGAGGGLAFLLSQINPRFYTSEEVKEFTRLPVLGTVSMVFSQHHRAERKMELAVFVLVVLGLTAVYGGLVALEVMHVDLPGHIKALVEAKA